MTVCRCLSISWSAATDVHQFENTCQCVNILHLGGHPIDDQARPTVATFTDPCWCILGRGPNTTPGHYYMLTVFVVYFAKMVVICEPCLLLISQISLISFKNPLVGYLSNGKSQIHGFFPGFSLNIGDYPRQVNLPGGGGCGSKQAASLNVTWILMCHEIPWFWHRTSPVDFFSIFWIQCVS